MNRPGQKSSAYLQAAMLTIGATLSCQPSAEDEFSPLARDFDQTGASIFETLTVIGSHELRQMRGGFTLQGMMFEFGVNARTYIDGHLALETMMNFVGGRDPVIQYSGGTALQGDSAAATDALNQLVGTPGITTTSNTDSPGTATSVVTDSIANATNTLSGDGGVASTGGSPTAVAPSGVTSGSATPATSVSGVAPTGTASAPSSGASPGLNTSVTLLDGNESSIDALGLLPANVNLASLKEASGVVINDRKGFTAALHDVTRERIVSVLVNTANGRDIRQELDVNVRVANFKEFRESVGNSLLSTRLSEISNR